MGLFKMIFYPKRGHSNSPGDAWSRINNHVEKAKIGEELQKLCHTIPQRWGEVVEIKPIGGIYQVTASNYRIFLWLDSEHDLIVVTHICRKVSQKAKKLDLDRAKLNLTAYFQSRDAGT